MLKSLARNIKILIKGGLLHIISGNFLSKVITMLSTVLIARLVTKELYAYYSYTTNLYSYVDLINGLEMSGALLVFCSRSEDDGRNKSWMIYCLSVSVVAQLLISLALCIVTSFVSIAYPEARRYIWMYLPIPICTTIINCLQAVVRAYGNNKLFSTMGVLRAAIVTVVSLVLVPLFDVEGMIFSIYIASFSIVLLGAKYCYNKLKNAKRISITVEEKKKFNKLALSFLTASFFSHIMPLNEAFLVNELIGDEVVSANYKVAGLIPQQLGLISSGICVYFYPTIAKTKDYKHAWQKIRKIGLCTAITIFVIADIAMIATPLIIRILYGEKYIDAISLSYALWIARMVESAIRVVPITFLPTLGDTKYNFIASPIFCVIHVLVDYLLILEYGIDGVAYATTIVNALYGICSWFYIRLYCKRKYIHSGA